MLSKKDKEILLFIEKYQSITISICAKVIFKGNKFAKDQATKKLRKMYKEKLIARYQSNRTSEAVYYTISRLGIHDLQLLSVYAEFISLGAKIDKFEREYRIYTQNGKKKYRDIDGLMEISYQDYKIPCIVEIDYAHYSSIEKFEDIFKSNHFQEIYGEDAFPLIIIVRPAVEPKLIIEKNLLILYTDWNLEGLEKALE